MTIWFPESELVDLAKEVKELTRSPRIDLTHLNEHLTVDEINHLYAAMLKAYRLETTKMIRNKKKKIKRRLDKIGVKR